MGDDFQGQFGCEKFSCPGCNDGLVDGQRKRKLGINENFKFCWTNSDDKNSKCLNPLNRFPYQLTRQLGSGGFACVYETVFHGKKTALKFIPLSKDQHQNNILSYGCHEYYYQEIWFIGTS